jgi:hypothetical protein
MEGDVVSGKDGEIFFGISGGGEDKTVFLSSPLEAPEVN